MVSIAFGSAGAVLLLGQASNQTAPEEPVLELSPFVVESSKDSGYLATSTLAGTRLSTPLKDLGASISIYTKDFLEDIGATNANELLVFATGMEAAGVQGNYSAAAADINATNVLGDDVRVRPQGAARTRGLASPNFSRGYFASDIPMDSYNTDVVTVNRGPNAILFGVGSPAGVVDTSLAKARLNKDSNMIEMRYGNNGAFRSSVDFNRVLVPQKLAARVAALYDREEYNQRPAFEEKKRLYGALTFEPFKKTTIRANFETGNILANRPITVLPYKGISDAWFAAGRPSFDWTLYDDPAKNASAAAQNAASFVAPGFMGQGQIFDQVVLVYSNPTDTAPAYGFVGETHVTNGTAANSIKAQVFNPVTNRDTAADNIFFTSTRNLSELAASAFPDGFRPAGIKEQGFIDYSAFDFRKRMLDETSYQTTAFHTSNISIEQRGWEDRVGIELTYDTQRIDRHSKNSFLSTNAGNAIRIDTSVTLPDGNLNPNLGRPYLFYGQTPWKRSMLEQESVRATGYIRYNFADVSDKLGKWLGRHSLTALYEENATDSISYAYRLAADGAAARAQNSGVQTFSRRPDIIAYIGPSIIGNNNSLQLVPIRLPEIVAGPTTAVTYFSRAANATDPGSFVSAATNLVEINNGGSASREVIKSQAAVLQSYWLSEHLITMFGWRRDEDYFVNQRIAFVRNDADLNDPGKVHYGFNDFSFAHTPPPNVSKETKSYSAVLRWPHKLIKLPGSMDFSVFYNKSENFTPIGGRVNAYNQPLPPPEGETEEFGFNLDLFNGKLGLRANWYETGVKGQASTTTVFNTATSNAVIQAASFWMTEGNNNPDNVASSNADVELLFSALPANYRDLYQLKVTGSAPNISPSFVNLLGRVDTTDFTAKGTELELVYNPTRKWRILMNVSRQETVQTNAYPGLKEFIARMTPVWDQLRSRPQATYPVGYGPSNPPPNVQTYGDWLDANVYVPYRTAIATEGVASAEQREWRVNLVTNYTFGRDSLLGPRLNGWGVGGAVRWQSRLGIGYPTSTDSAGVVNIDIANPYYAPAETNVDAWISYSRKIWKDKINWKVQLNVRNLIGDTDPVAITVQPWGDVATARLAPERRWYLSSSFAF